MKHPAEDFLIATKDERSMRLADMPPMVSVLPRRLLRIVYFDLYLPVWVSAELDKIDFQFGKIELTLHEGHVVQLVVRRTELIKGCRSFLEPAQFRSGDNSTR